MAARNGETTLLLVRSGRTAWDLGGRVQGSSDIPLCPEGRAEVEAALAEADLEKAHCIWAAPDEGSQETAQLLARLVGCKIKTSYDLAEMDLGLWEGSLRKDLLERFAKSYGLWREDPTAVTPAEGEPLPEARGRLLRVLEKIVERPTKSPKAMVLRPVMLGLLKCCVSGEPASRLWEVMATQPQCETITVRPSDLFSLREEASVS
ncbi:MAG: histidine phosphatase family protein [Phycisphaerales bacterium JB038]